MANKTNRRWLAVFWGVWPCSEVNIVLVMEAVSTFETSVIIWQTSWFNTAQDSHLPTGQPLEPGISRDEQRFLSSLNVFDSGTLLSASLFWTFCVVC
jgi:hypothetical protein